MSANKPRLAASPGADDRKRQVLQTLAVVVRHLRPGLDLLVGGDPAESESLKNLPYFVLVLPIRLDGHEPGAGRGALRTTAPSAGSSRNQDELAPHTAIFRVEKERSVPHTAHGDHVKSVRYTANEVEILTG